MSVDFQVDGLSELEEKLKKLGGDEFADKAVYGALMDAAKPIADAAKENAPRSAKPYYRYWRGKLDKSTGQRNGTRKQMQGGTLESNIVRRRVKGYEHPAVTVTVRDKAFYWRFFEFGTSKQAAKPFLRPAFDAHVDDALEVFKRRLKRRIDLIAKKQGIDLDADDAS